MSNLDESAIQVIIAAWQEFLKNRDWRELIAGVEPKPTGCGPVYELPNYLERADESFAIADMRGLKFAEPHYHSGGETEVYVVLQGSALVVVGGKERRVSPGDAVIIPPDTAHFTIPGSDYVIAAINTPPLRPENYIPLKDSNPTVHFDQAQFKKLAL